MEYTKGEWKITEWNDKRGFNIFTYDAFIASVPLSQANANLISAAPDIYEALKATIRIIEVEHLVVPIKCKEAIAKAEGK